MYFKGVELTKLKTIKYCSDNTCTNLIPICCLYLTHDCSESSTKWHHISAGEHVCSACYNYLYSFFSYEVDNVEINAWKEGWIARSHETPTMLDYITSTLLSNWYLCSECGKWRQANRNISLCHTEIYQFSCKMIIKHTSSPCKIAEDERIEFIRNHPASFFDSVKYAAYLNSSPYLEVYDEYQLDTIGILPITKNDFNFNEPCEGFMSVFNPFAKENKFQITAGAIDPTSMDKWEHDFFQTFAGNLRNIFIGLRNLMFLLWSADPKRIIDINVLSKCVFIRGLLKVALLINSVPDMIRIYSTFGYINFGFPSGPLNLFDDLKKKEVIVIGAGLSGLAAARHLSLLGVNVTVLEANKNLVDDKHKFPEKLAQFEYLNEVYGVINNPFSVMAYQCDIEMQEVSTNLSIFNLNGDIIPDDVDQFYQNLVYNFVAYLMEGSSVIRNTNAYNNWSLADLYRDYRRLRMSKKYSSYDAVEHVYLSEIEYRVFGGSSMESIPRDIPMPCMNRNMFNFSYKQFSGITMEPVIRNWDKFLQNLTSSLDIRYSTRVSAISYTGKKYVLSIGDAEEDEKFQADKILFAMAPGNYFKIVSEPDWLTNRNIVDKDVAVDTQTISGDHKGVDINPSGSNAFIIIQMAYHNNDLFWRHKIPTDSAERAFSIVPASEEMRGFCHLFKETKVIKEENLTILQTKIFGLASKIINMSDEEIIQNILDKLRPLSDRPDGPPKPKWYKISKIDNALQSCTDLGIKCRQLSVAEQYQEDIFVTNKSDILAEPISLSNSFCVGMDAASSILKTFL